MIPGTSIRAAVWVVEEAMGGDEGPAAVVIVPDDLAVVVDAICRGVTSGGKIDGGESATAWVAEKAAAE
jgi:hypothetical protein